MSATAEQQVAELRQAFSPGGEYAICDDACCHGECEAGRFIIGVVGGTP